MTKHGTSVGERFWEKVEVRGPDECWPWKAGTSDTGYGQFGVTGDQIVGAHRVAYELAKGPIPAGMGVCHDCDNPPCCNPKHLWPGTRLDNIRDCEAKGRGVHPRGERNGTHTHPERLRRGEAHCRAKLTDAKVREIRRLFSEGHSKHEMARLMSVAQSTIRSVVRGETWKHVKAYQNDDSH